MSRREATKPLVKERMNQKPKVFLRNGNNHLKMLLIFIHFESYHNSFTDEIMMIFFLQLLDGRNSNPPLDAEVCIERRNPSTFISGL